MTRSPGLDVARALAIAGMFVVHAGVVLAPTSDLLAFAVFDGRAAATFLVVAGIATARGALPGRRLVRRGALLVGLGIANLVVWPGDILRIYGVALLLAPLLRRARSRVLIAITLALFAGFVPLLVYADWEANWRWEDLTYVGLWTPTGFVRHLAFDGFRSLVPWLGLYTLGLALGRQGDRRLARLALPGAALATAAGAASWLAVGELPASLPPLPLFLASAAGLALATIGASIALAAKAPRLSAPLARTGRLAGTWYLAHIAALVALALAGVTLPGTTALAAAIAAFAVVVAISRATNGPGPFERLLRAT